MGDRRGGGWGAMCRAKGLGGNRGMGGAGGGQPGGFGAPPDRPPPGLCAGGLGGRLLLLPLRCLPDGPRAAGLLLTPNRGGFAPKNGARRPPHSGAAPEEGDVPQNRGFSPQNGSESHRMEERHPGTARPNPERGRFTPKRGMSRPPPINPLTPPRPVPADFTDTRGDGGGRWCLLTPPTAGGGAEQGARDTPPQIRSDPPTAKGRRQHPHPPPINTGVKRGGERRPDPPQNRGQHAAPPNKYWSVL